MKLSSEKSNLPGRKQVIRQYEDGTAVRDVIATEESDRHAGAPLLARMMAGGERTDAGTERPIDALREHARARIAELPDRVRALGADTEGYEVVLSDAMEERLTETRAELRKTMTMAAQ